jgi:hypothetical protein
MRATIAADIALVLFAVFGILGFGWRSWLQYRRTGSTGFRGTSGRIGSTEWIAGLGFVVALMVAVTSAILQRANVIQPISILTAVWTQFAGIAGAMIGIAATVYAQLEMGDSWRIGVDEQETTTLVHRRVRPGTRRHLHRNVHVWSRDRAGDTESRCLRRLCPARLHDRAPGPPCRGAASIAPIPPAWAGSFQVSG